MAGVAIGSAAMGGAASVAAAAYQASVGFTARHETTHAQQIDITKRLIAEFEDAYNKGEVYEEDWAQYLLLRDQARETEKAYEDSINAYKETPLFKFLSKSKLKRDVRKQKKKLRQSNRSLRSHYDHWSSDASATSSVSATHGSPPGSLITDDEDEDDVMIWNWARDVAENGDEESASEHEGGDNDEVPQQNFRRLHLIKTNCYIETLSFSPDSKQVVSTSTGGKIQIWDIDDTENYVRQLHGHTATVWSVAFSADGKKFVSGSMDNTLRIWDVQTGVCVVGPLSGHSGTISCVAFSPDGQMVVSGAGDNTVRIWNAQTGREISRRLKGHTAEVQSVSFSPDSKRVISTSGDFTIRVWDVRKGKMVVGPLKNGSNAHFICALFHPYQNRLLSFSTDRTISLWNAKTGKIIMSLSGKETPSESYTSFSQDCRFAIWGSRNGTIVSIADLVSMAVLSGPSGGYSKKPTCIAVSLDGKKMAIGPQVENTIDYPSAVPDEYSRSDRRKVTGLRGWASAILRPLFGKPN